MFDFLKKKKPEVITDSKKIDEIVTRGVAEVLPTRDGLKELLQSGGRIRLYQGFDPTGTQLHIGHMVGLRKLAQFQQLGHEVIFLIGDGTGQAGDPSGKTKSRDTFFTTEELRENAREYVSQAGKVVSFDGPNPAQMRFNGDWLNELRLTDILHIAELVSLQQLSERDIFKERMKRGEAVNLREFLYPLLQGYDSVAMNVDLEIGATDQTFNMLMGRTLLKKMRDKEKFVLSTPLLTDAQGTKIGKTEGNVIALTDEPHDLYGKIMALGDDVIVSGFEYLTDVSMGEVRAIEQKLGSGENPLLFKKQLARDIVAQLHSKEAAQQAQDEFEHVFSKKEMPREVHEIEITRGEELGDVFVGNKLLDSRSEVRRRLEQGALYMLTQDNKEEQVPDADLHYKIQDTHLWKYGKKDFVKIIVK